jgi:hypothetical protein
MAESAKGVAVAKRFIVAFFTFIGLIFPADSAARAASLQARIKHLGAAHGAEVCAATRLYFLEVVKTRAVTALCRNGPERDRELGRLDADVETINNAIAASCS